MDLPDSLFDQIVSRLLERFPICKCGSIVGDRDLHAQDHRRRQYKPEPKQHIGPCPEQSHIYVKDSGGHWARVSCQVDQPIPHIHCGLYDGMSQTWSSPEPLMA